MREGIQPRKAAQPEGVRFLVVDRGEPRVNDFPAREPRLDLASTLASLWLLTAHSGRSRLNSIGLAVALTVLAAIIDVAALGLLRWALAAGTAEAGPRQAVGAAFLLVALAGAGLRILAQRRTVDAQFAVNYALSIRAFRVLQQQQYADYMRRGASEGFAAFDRLQAVAYFGVTQLIAGASAILSALIMLAGVTVLYPWAGAMLGVFLLAVLAETAWRGRTPAKAGISGLARERALLLYEARMGFRHIFLANGQARMSDDFARVEHLYRGEQARVALESQSSRQAIEIAGLLIALAALSALALLSASGSALVPFLAVVALAAFRLLPQIATLRSALRLIGLHADVTEDVRELVSRPLTDPSSPAVRPMQLNRAVRLEGLTLAWPGRPPTLDGVTLEIPRYRRIGIRGASGAGKSSLLDILCGATAPDAGSVFIDDVALNATTRPAWRERIGVVSQNPVLLGATLREAVVFPDRTEDADEARFDAAVAAAGVAAMVADFPRGLDTSIGEASGLLSGGQRQRVALAHALYRARDLLVLDEATSQLDAESEAAIVAAIRAAPRDLTIVVAGHREAAFACCDEIHRLEAGRLVRDD